MAKITLADVTNILGSPSTAQSTINSNSNLIEAAFENTVSRDGTTPNHMLADFDMNDHDILNVNVIDAKSFSIDGSTDFTSLLEQAAEEADRSEAAAVRAEIAADEAEVFAGFVKNNWVIAGPFVGTGIEQDYLLPIDPGGAENLFVIVGGVGQMLTTDAYSLVYSAGSPYLRVNVPTGVSFEARVGNSMVFGTPSDGTVSTTKIADDAVTFQKTQNIATSRILGRVSAGSGDIEELTVSQVVGLTTPVQYVAQTLNSSQQQQARNNISAPLAGYLNGLFFQNDTTDATNDFLITAGAASSDDGVPLLMRLPSNFIKRTDAAWSAGTNQGCWLDGASMPNGTGHTYLIHNPTTGAVDVGVSASLSPTLPSGYTHKRRIFSILRESGALVQILHRGDNFLRATPINVWNSTAAQTTTALTLPIPLGLPLEAQLYSSQQQGTAGNCQTLMSTPGTSMQAYAVTTAANEVSVSDIRKGLYTNTSAQINFAVSIFSGSLGSNVIVSNGWTDTRGK